MPSRRALRTAAALAVGAAAWELQRRADARRVADDPETAELSRPLHGHPVEVTAPDGTRLHAEVFGPDGRPTIVLAHGWVCELDYWHYQVRDLAGEFRVVAWDQRGHGRSSDPGRGAYTPEALGDDLQAVLDACVPAGERCVLVGHSMGGMTIVSWAGRHPDEVRRRVAAAVLVSTGMGDLSTELLVLRPPQWANRAWEAIMPRLVGSTLPTAKTPTPISHRLIRHVAYSPYASEGRVAFGERMILRCPAPVRGGFGRMFHTLDLHEHVPRLDVPTAVIVGELDRLTPPSLARRIAESLPQLVGLVELPRVGHMAPHEAPEVVSQWARDLARRHLANPRPSGNGQAGDAAFILPVAPDTSPAAEARADRP